MFAGNWSEQVINFVVFISLARLLGANVFGLATMAVVFVLFAEFLVRQSLTEAIIQIKDLEQGHLDVVFWLLGALAILLVSLLAVFADNIAAIFSQPSIAEYTIWASSSVLIIGFSGVPVSLLRRELKFGMLAVRATIGVFIGGVVGVTLALMGYGVWGFIAFRVIQVLINGVLAWIAHPWLPGFRATRRHFNEVIAFSGHIVGFRLTELISINTPLIVIGAYLGPALLGQYTIAWRLIEVGSFLLIAPIQIVAQPAFAHLNRGNENAGKLLITTLQASSLIAFMSYAGLATIADPTISLLFGVDWKAAVPVLQVLCLVGIYLSIERLQQVFCLAIGHVKGIFYISFSEALVGVLLMVYLVQYGTVGVAIGFVARYFILWPWRFYLVSKYTGLATVNTLRVLAVPLTNSLLVATILIGWRQWLAADGPVVLTFITSIAIGIFAYSILTWLTMRNQILELVTSIKLWQKN